MITGLLVKLATITTDTLYENVGTKLLIVMTSVSAGYMSVLVCALLEIVTTIFSIDEVFVGGNIHDTVADTSLIDVTVKSLISPVVPATSQSM